MNALTPVTATAGELADLTQRANDYAVASHGIGTRRAYSSGWNHYVEWCTKFGREPLSGDPGAVALYITDCADFGHAAATINVRIAAIGKAHKMAGVSLNLKDATLVAVRSGINRTIGTAPKRKAAVVTRAEIRLMLAACAPSTDRMGARDRAIILIQFGSLLRRDEVAKLNIGDVELVPGKGLRVTIRKSKTDQTGAGEVVRINANPADPAFCAVRAFEQWMQHRRQASDGGAPDRALFCRTGLRHAFSGEGIGDLAVRDVVKSAADKAGLDADAISGHTLRRSGITAAAEAGASLSEIMTQSRHKSVKVAMGYIDNANEWNNASSMAFGGGRAE